MDSMSNQNLYRKICLLSTMLSLAFFQPLDSRAAPGDLDAGFGNGGIVVMPITDGANLYVEPNSLLVQMDGKIVVCGTGLLLRRGNRLSRFVFSRSLQSDGDARHFVRRKRQRHRAPRRQPRRRICRTEHSINKASKSMSFDQRRGHGTSANKESQKGFCSPRWTLL